MFDAMVELFNEGKPVDLVTLQDRLKEKDVPPEVSSLEFVRDIITSVPTSANVRPMRRLSVRKQCCEGSSRSTRRLPIPVMQEKSHWKRFWQDTEKSIFDLLQNEGRMNLCRSSRWH